MLYKVFFKSFKLLEKQIVCLMEQDYCHVCNRLGRTGNNQLHIKIRIVMLPT